MFMDEMEHIERGMAVDSAFSKEIRKTGSARNSGDSYALRMEWREKNPTARARNAAACLDPSTGRGWWQQGAKWKSRQESK